MNNNDLRKRVQRGIDLLDEKGPVNWRSKLDFETFDIDHGSRCALGQVYGEYSVGYHALGLYEYRERLEHGYTTGTIHESAHINRLWEEMVKQPVVAPTFVTFTPADVKLLAKRMKQIQDPAHSLWGTTLKIQGVTIKLGED